MEDVLVNLISNVGFPIAIAVYLILRVDGRLEKLNETMAGVNTNLALILSKLNKD